MPSSGNRSAYFSASASDLPFVRSGAAVGIFFRVCRKMDRRRTYRWTGWRGIPSALAAVRLSLWARLPHPGWLTRWAWWFPGGPSPRPCCLVWTRVSPPDERTLLALGSERARRPEESFAEQSARLGAPVSGLLVSREPSELQREAGPAGGGGRSACELALPKVGPHRLAEKTPPRVPARLLLSSPALLLSFCEPLSAAQCLLLSFPALSLAVASASH